MSYKLLKKQKNMKKIIYLNLLFVGLIFSSCSSGDSKLENNNSNEEQPIAGKFKKNVLIEDYTGTWCQFCPRVIYGIQKVETEGLSAYPVAIHRGNPPGSSSAVDPFNFPASALETSIGLTGYPTAKLNRTTTWINETSTYEVKSLIKLNADLGIAMNSNVSGSNINLDVNVKFDANLTGLKLIVYILEDNLIYNQINSTSYFGGANPIVNMEHDHVLRACLTDLVNGDALTGTNDGAIVTKNFNITVPSNISNSANMSFIAFVVGSDGKAINVRAALPNVNQTFQENQ